MADKKAVGHAYNVDFLNVVFAASSIFLSLSVIWMVWDDFDRDWKNTQRRLAQLEYQVKQALAEDEAKKLNTLNLAMEKAIADKAEVQKQLGVYTAQAADAQKKIEEANAEQMRLSKRLTVLAPSPTKAYFRDAPLLDFMAPTLKVQQIILPNVVDDVNFIRVPKMDRCQTCHLAIDKKGYEKYPQPFTTHPDLATYLGGSSTHPIDKVGCTVCHEGMGQSVSFRDAAHMPSNEKQKEEWEKKYHWEEPHLWDFPMLPVKMTEASCVKCHKQQVYIPKAENLNVAYATYERAGCYACHKTRGFDTNVRKPGPILTKIDSKLTQDWVKNWIRNPRAVKPTTWMPRFWYNSNNSSPEDAVRNEAEIGGIAAYLFANADKHEFAVKNPAHGDAKRGEQIVKDVGCQGCHVVGEGSREAAGPRRTFGQPLENIGNKTSYEWIFNWVRDPKHYSPATFMPNLRLTDAQVADVATYLVGLKGPAGDAAKATPDQKASDDVLLDYLKAVLPIEDAKAQR